MFFLQHAMRPATHRTSTACSVPARVRPIVAGIEAGQALVAANRELIAATKKRFTPPSPAMQEAAGRSAHYPAATGQETFPTHFPHVNMARTPDTHIPAIGTRPQESLKRPSPALRYGAAILLAAVAQAARLPLHPPHLMPYITYVPVILLSAAYGGLGPGLLSAVLCALESIYFATEPIGRLRAATIQDWLHSTGLALTGLFASVLFEWLRRALERQHAAYLQLATVQDAAPVMLLVVDDALRVRKANDLAGQFAGRNVSDMRSLGLDRAIGCLNGLVDPGGCGHGPACAECAIRQAVLDTVRNGTSHRGVEAWVPLSVDGLVQTRCLQVSIAPIHLNQTGTTALICAQDITERRLAEAALREQHVALHRQATLIDLSHDAIVAADQNRVITGWNTGAQEMYGWTEAEALGNAIDRLLRTSATISTGTIDEILNRAGRWDGQLEHSSRDGTRLTVDSRQVLLRDPEGNPAGIMEINRDITERKRMDDALRDAKDQLTAHAAELERLVVERTGQLRETIGELEGFSYSISHDMRAPLRAMQSYSQFLVDEYGGKLDEQGLHYLHQIIRSAVRLDRLTQDVLSYTRILHSELPMDRVDLDRLVRGIVEAFPNGRPIKPEIQIKGGLPKVVGNEALLAQCISNLLNNAAKFVSPGTIPHVEISAEAMDDDWIRVWFKDNGIGIAPENHDRVFRLLERVHPATEFEGTGLGLTIVHKAVERMGAQLGFESVLGEGSNFWIQLKKG